jgi:hypothetical protein
MTKEEILRDNKIIAEFMGLKQSKWPGGELLWVQKSFIENFHDVEDYLVESKFDWENSLPQCKELLYHISWDWLMPVVEKIEEIYDYYHGHIDVHIVSNSCTIKSTNFESDYSDSEPPHHFNTYTLGSKLKSTYIAVVEFIKWYNNHLIQE